ncbi:transposase [Fodinicola acaciae]|uniref:transposase n=1 Tax=Fodinicola acaciae TaxID=2681555 RepID=UPI001C9E9347
MATVAVAGARGVPWRDVPPVYGSWRAIYGLFRRRQRAGVWAGILCRLQADADAAGLISWDVRVGEAEPDDHALGGARRLDNQVASGHRASTKTALPGRHGRSAW